MSNIVVGDVYRQIIERIVQVAQNDFEEGGYAPETLQDLRKIWQENLSKLHVAQMPWDPTTAQSSVPANLPSSVKTETRSPAANGDSVTIKQEPKQMPEIKYETPAGYGPMNGYAGAGVNNMAQQRAANHLRQQFGTQANASIQAAGLPQQPNSQQTTSQQRLHQMTTQGQRSGQTSYQNGLGAAQTDGAADLQHSWQAIVTDNRVDASDRIVVDGMLRRQLDQQVAVEDAGLGLPNTTVSPSNRKGKMQRNSSSAPRIPQTDGADEEDEDAINSDLDDSEDEVEQEKEDDDGPLGEMMLCTWDKVNRVKNKWKCTLKDGVLATGGKEYLFHKATGEFEW